MLIQKEESVRKHKRVIKEWVENDEWKKIVDTQKVEREVFKRILKEPSTEN